MPGALGNDVEFACCEVGRLLAVAPEEVDRRMALEDHDDLVSDGVTFPLAPTCPMPYEDPAVAVVRQEREGVPRLLGGGRGRPVGEECQLRDRSVDRDRDGREIAHGTTVCDAVTGTSRCSHRGPGGALASSFLPDPIFADPRLARIYDPLDADRSDLNLYMAIVDEVGARSVLDIGCGTGTFACLLADREIEVIGVDPAEASLTVARSKPGAERVRWIHGDATSLPPITADLATMTGNVAQVFHHDDELAAALRGIRGAVRSGGSVVFEVRDPDREAWRSWTREQSERRTDVPGVGVVQSWVELLQVSLPFVSFRWTYRFEDGGDVTSDSTLCFRSRAEVERVAAESGLVVRDVRDAPDRPGLELVFVCGITRDDWGGPICR